MSDTFIGQILLLATNVNVPPKDFALCDGTLINISQNTALFSLIGTIYGGNGQSNFALPDLRGRVPLHFGQGPGLSLYDQGEAAGSDTITLDVTHIPAHTHALTSTLTATAKCKNASGNQLTPVGNVPANEAGAVNQPFTDDPLTPGSSAIKALHITELRSRIDALRQSLMLGPGSYADPSLAAGTTINAQHIIDLRNALAPALGAATPAYTDPNLGIGTPIKAVHIAELRSAVAPGAYSNAVPDASMNAGAIDVSGPSAATGGLPHNNLQPYLTMNYCIALQGVYPARS